MILSRRSRQRNSDATAASFRKAVAAQTAMLALIVVLFSSRQAQAFDTAHELAARCESVDTSTTGRARCIHTGNKRSVAVLGLYAGDARFISTRG